MTAVPSAALRRRPSLASLRLGWDEGDLWTVGLGLVLALALALSTIPAVLDARDGAPRAAAPPDQVPLAPAEAGAPEAPPAAPVALPPGPVTQPLLGPLAPLGPAATSGGDLYAQEEDLGPTSGSGAPPPAPGEVRQFAVLAAGADPGAVATAADGGVWAATDAPPPDGGPSELLSWDAAGVLKATVAAPEQPADRIRGVTGLVAMTDASIVAVDAATNRVLRYDASASSWTTLATVPDVPPCLLPTGDDCQPGLLDSAPMLRGLATDATGVLYVADAGQGTVWRLTPGTPIEPWYSSADISGDEGVAGLAVGADGHLRAVVTRLAAVQGTAAGALLRIDRAEDGSAGARTVVSAFSAGEDPVDVALGASGNAYVALRGADAVVVLDASGVEQLRVVEDAMKDPSALELVAGRLLVTAAGPDPAVLEVGVADEPVAPATTTPGGTSRG